MSFFLQPPNANARNEIYLDANATTKVLPLAAQAAMSAMEQAFGNPSSSHITGLQAKHLMEQTRKLAATVVGAGDGKIIFTSGATEGIQTAIISALIAAKEQGLVSSDSVLMYGATEHKAVPTTMAHWNHILGINATILAIPVDRQGLLDYAFIKANLPQTLLICTMAVNNETGVFQDLAALNSLISQSKTKAKWMVDCVQGLGKIALDLASTCIDYAPFSGHKLYAPKGIGWLYIKQGSPFTPVIAGGGQEGGLRSGTENIPGMAALKVILEALQNNNETVFRTHERLVDFRQQLKNALVQSFKDVVFNHDFSVSVPTTLNFSVPNFSSKEIMDLFDAAGIRVSSGSACSSKVTRSFVLDAMKLPSWQSESAIRMSFGPAITQEEISEACERIITASKALHQSCLIFSDKEDDSQTFGINGLIQLKHGGSCSWLYCESGSKDCVIIDPLPALAARFNNMIRCRHLNLKAILDTHGHADHVSCRLEVMALLSDVMPENALITDELGWPKRHDFMVLLADGQKVPAVKLGKQLIAKVDLAGHTDDSRAFLIGKNSIDNYLSPKDVAFCFIGDTILIESLGRTNFVNSNPAALFTSLKNIAQIVDNKTLLCPAHDYHHQFTTNLETEIKHNTLLAGVVNNVLSLDDFIDKKQKLDKYICDQQGTELMCGGYAPESSLSSVEKEISPDTLRQWLMAGKSLSLVDIREPHEHSLMDVNLAENVVDFVNIPLTRIAQFIYDMQLNNSHYPVVFICRSGSRSKLAASSLRRLGFENITHVIGGYALS